MVRPGRTALAAAVRSTTVVLTKRTPRATVRWCRSPKINIRSVSSVLTVRTEPLGETVRPWAGRRSGRPGSPPRSMRCSAPKVSGSSSARHWPHGRTRMTRGWWAPRAATCSNGCWSSTKPIWRQCWMSTECTTTAIGRTSPGHTDHRTQRRSAAPGEPLRPSYPPQTILAGLINEYEHAA